MKNILTVLLTIIGIYSGNCQTNLIPNPSFEDLTDCPNDNAAIAESMIELAKPWFGAIYTPDLFNKCAESDGRLGVKKNLPCPCGRMPHSGDGYAGLFVFGAFVEYQAEYMEVKLLKKLSPKTLYYISFFAISNRCTKRNICTSDALGLAFSDTLYKRERVPGVDHVPNYKTAIQNPRGNILQDTFNWTKISGCYQAKGTEQYAIIGKFVPNKDCKSKDCDMVGGSYYFIDDVSVYELGKSGNDTVSICTGEPKKIGRFFSGATYSWNTGQKDSSITVDKPGQYIQNITIDGCRISDTMTVVDIAQLVKNISNDTILCKGDLLKINLPKDAEYLWSDGNKSNNVVIDKAGIYSVNIKNICGQINHIFEVKSEICDCNVYIPNAFSPNDDGINDYLECSVGCDFLFKSSRFQVFNRWGELVYLNNSIDYKSIKWDGTFRGQLLNSGVYSWTYEYEYIQKGKIYKKAISGDVAIK